jgi:serine/threonine-protein kinase
MGEVYRARDTKLKRDVALKVLPEAFAQDPDRLARFQREAELLATLNHPNIAAIFSIEDGDRVRFMTMELIDGRTLDRLVADGAVPMALFFEIAVALAEGLSAAHRKQIIHRDLKPSNVIVSPDGRVRILDFGLARTVDADSVRPADAVTRLDLTHAGKVVGTLPYMSPEQIEGRPLDHRTDLFSLGVLLYELATGDRPFRGDSAAALTSAILRDRPAPAGNGAPTSPRSSSMRRPRPATPRWRARPCCSRTTATWRKRSSRGRWSSGPVTCWAAAGTPSSIFNGLAGSSRKVSPKHAGRSTSIRCPRTPPCSSG